MDEKSDLLQYREKINRIDEQIIELLGKRYSIIREIALYKYNNNIKVMQNSRVNEVINANIQLALNNNIKKEYIIDLYKLIIDTSCNEENLIISNFLKNSN